MIPEPPQPTRWQFPKDDLAKLDPTDYDEAVFVIRPRVYRDSLFSQYLREKGFEFDEYASHRIYGHILKIELGDTVIEDPKIIAQFVDNMEEARGWMVQLAILRREGYLDRGTVKNS